MPRPGEGRHRPLRRRPTRLHQDHYHFGELVASLTNDLERTNGHGRASQRLVEQVLLIIPIEAPLNTSNEARPSGNLEYRALLREPSCFRTVTWFVKVEICIPTDRSKTPLTVAPLSIPDGPGTYLPRLVIYIPTPSRPDLLSPLPHP